MCEGVEWVSTGLEQGPMVGFFINTVMKLRAK